MAIDYDELRQAIRTMSVRSRLYKLLKEELTLRGYWKNRTRGWHAAELLQPAAKFKTPDEVEEAFRSLRRKKQP